MFHISDLKKYMRCPRLFWNSLHIESEPYNSYVRLDEELSSLACEKLDVDNYFLGARGDDPSKSLEASKKYEWLVKARFEYHDLRIKAPFMHKVNDGWDLIFIFCGNYPHGDDILFYSATCWVLQNNGFKINNIELLHFDANYVLQDKLEPKELFVLSDSFYNSSNNPTINAKDKILKCLINYDPYLEEMEKIKDAPFVKAIRQNKCTRKNKCNYYDNCFPDEAIKEDNSILSLVSSQYKYQMNKEGINHLKDVDLNRLEGSRQQFAQIMADRNGGIFCDKIALKALLDTYKFPLIFLDFEWETYAIPPYKGMKPFEVLPFEYSLHILDESGNLEHKEFIGTKDCRYELVKKLIKDTPNKGTVIAFNAEGAEKIRINEFINMYPELKGSLNSINRRMVDLSLPFSLGIVYDVQMRGLYSVKAIMNLMDTKYSYQKLDIHQGMEAVFQWRKLDKQQEDIDDNRIKENLKAYCGLDTYSMIIIYKWLENLCDKA